ncbi:MAG: Imm63 family immunity protein [Janthinobacterium lividum]
MLTLGALEAVITALGQLVQAPPELLPTFGHNRDFAYPEVRVDARGYHFVVIERGQELEHQVFPQLAELLFTVFSSVTFSLAGSYEVQHRRAGQDTRILLFARQVELLARLDASWAARRRAEADWYLAGRPGPRPSDP